jgi:hypothetical protein
MDIPVARLRRQCWEDWELRIKNWEVWSS